VFNNTNMPAKNQNRLNIKLHRSSVLDVAFFAVIDFLQQKIIHNLTGICCPLRSRTINYSNLKVLERTTFYE
jgi:hypothetical protein